MGVETLLQQAEEPNEVDEKDNKKEADEKDNKKDNTNVASKLAAVQDLLAQCNANTKARLEAEPEKPSPQSKKKADDEDVAQKEEQAENQKKDIKKAVHKAHDHDVREKVLALAAQANAFKKRESGEVASEVHREVDAAKQVAEAKLSKGAKDEAVAKEALKKALQVSD